MPDPQRYPHSAPGGASRRRTTSRLPLVTVLAVLGILLLLALIVGLGGQVTWRPAQAEGDCVPTSAQDCGCVSDSAAASGITPVDDRTLSTDQRAFREEEFTHDGVSSRYRVYDHGLPEGRATGVLVRLHGDGAYEYTSSPILPACLAAVAADRGLILVQPLTPAEDLTWWTDLGPTTAWLAALHRERLVALTPDAGANTWWMGYSGGAEMITYGLLPRAGDVVSGGAVMVGGGGAPDDPSTQVTVTGARRAELPLTWVTGTRDDGTDPRATFDALSASREGAEFYRSRGFGAVYTDFSRDADHFTIDQVNVLHNSLP